MCTAAPLISSQSIKLSLSMPVWPFSLRRKQTPKPEVEERVVQPLYNVPLTAIKKKKEKAPPLPPPKAQPAKTPK